MNRMMKLLISILFSLGAASVSFAASLYYFENFDSFPADSAHFITTNGSYSTNGWIWNFHMSRDIYVNEINPTGYDVDWPSGVGFTNNGGGTDYKMFIFGKPNNNALLWNNWYLGDGVKFDPKNNSALGSTNINATPEDPFGYTIIRYETSIDARSINAFAGYNGAYQKGYVDVGLAEDNGAANPNDFFNNYVFFYDKSLYGASLNNWGYFNNADYDTTFASLNQDVDGINPGTLATAFQAQMDNNVGTGAERNSKRYGTAYNNSIKAPLGIKLTTDGTTIKIYINPNPTNNTSLNVSNTWVKVATINNPLKNDILAIIGTEGSFFREEAVEAQYDNFLIRTIASNITASISPQKVMINQSIPFKVTVTPYLSSTNDSGIGEIIVRKPGNYGAWTAGNVGVTNNGTTGLSRILTGTPGAGQCLVKDIGNNELSIRFNMQNRSQNQIVTNGYVDIYFTLTTPAAADQSSGGATFEVYGDCVKHNDTGIDWVFDNANGIKYATTGRKKAVEAASGALTVLAYSQPQAYGKVEYSPSPIIVGNDSASFTYKISTEGLLNTPNISSARIYIPAGFNVAGNSISETNIVSAVLGPTASFDNIQKITGLSNYIVVQYTNLPGGGLPGQEGFDRITFTETGTPGNIGVASTNYLWQAEVNSDWIIQGANWQKAQTNQVYNTMQVNIASSNAQARGWIYPDTVSINTVSVSNSYNYRYSLTNEGSLSNNIKGIRISIPDVMSNVIILSNAVANTVKTISNGYIWVYYTNANGGMGLTNQGDVIYFTANHIITNVNTNSIAADFSLLADNNNGGGYVVQQAKQGQTWTVSIVPPNIDAEDVLTVQRGTNYINPLISTTESTNWLKFMIYNSSPQGVAIQMTRIEFNTNDVAEILDAVSSNIGTGITGVQIATNTDGDKLYLKLYYTNNGQAIQSRNDDPVHYFDTVLVKIRDTIKIQTNIGIPVNVFKASEETNLQFYSNICGVGVKFPGTNKLYVEYPIANIAYGISNMSGKPGEIDSSTVTNTIGYHVENMGDVGNKIYQMVIPVNRGVSTNILDVPFNTAENEIELEMDLDGGQETNLVFRMVDIINSSNVTAVYFSPSVTNDRGWASNILTTVSGGQGYLDFKVQQPRGGIGLSNHIALLNMGDGSTNYEQFAIQLTNTGANNDKFYTLKLELPPVLQGMISNVYSKVLNKSSSNYMEINITKTNITVSYSNLAIMGGHGDTLLIDAYITNENTMPAVGMWKASVSNGFADMGPSPPVTYFPLTNQDMGSLAEYGTEKADVEIIGADLTSQLTNNFILEIQNGRSGSQPIRKVKIKIPTPYTVQSAADDDVDVTLFTEQNKYVTNDGYIWIDYTGTELPAQTKSAFKIRALKPRLPDTTTADWKTEVYYSSNTTGAASEVKGNTIQQIVLPQVKFYAYTTNTNVNRDMEFLNVTMVITNAAEAGNGLYKVKIIPPTTNGNPMNIITNISMLSSDLAGTNIWYSNDGCIYVDYGKNGTNIQANPLTGRTYDEIRFRAYDNAVSAGFSGFWTGGAANASSMTNYLVSQDPSYIGKSLMYSVVIPAYSSTYYITPQEISTVADTNDFWVYFNNTSSLTGNNIDSARIYIRLPFVTNGITVSGSLMASNKVMQDINGSQTNYYIETYYGNGIFIPGTNEAIHLNLRDNWLYGNTNVVMDVTTRFNTSSLNYVETMISSGSNNIRFDMPLPEFSAGITPNSIYTTQDKANLRIRLYNTGAPYNDGKIIKLMVNENYTNGLSVGSLTAGSSATNISFDGQDQYTVAYSNFTSGKTNDLILSVSNTQKDTVNGLQFGIGVDNGFQTTNLFISLNAATSPTAELVTKKVWSTEKTNQVVVNFVNSTSGDSSVYNVRITVPNVYTNISDVTSLYGVLQTNGTTNIILHYTNGLAKGPVNDQITMNVWDNKDLYETNKLEWVVEADNSTGFGRARESASDSLKQNMVIPAPEIFSYQETKWFITGEAGKTNEYRMAISNAGSGDNVAVSNVINLPWELTNIVSMTASYTGAVITHSLSNQMLVVYTNTGYFKPGEGNEISILFINNTTTAANPVVEVIGCNGSSEGNNTNILQMDFSPAPNPAKGYVYNNQIIYSIDHEADVKYKVLNDMPARPIKIIQIGWISSNLTITNIHSEVFGGSIAFTTNATNVMIDYGSLGSGISSNETLTISSVYTNNISWTNDMASYVLYDKSLKYEQTIPASGEANILPVMIADFGRIKGIVLPPGASPTVKLYNPGGTTIAVTAAGTNITASADSLTGQYTLDFVPGGNYDISFVGDKYKETRLTGISVANNQITNLDVYKMKKAVFTPGSGSSQEALSLDDTNTSIEVPAGALGEYFSVDIWITNLSVVSEMVEKIAQAKAVTKPNNSGLVKVYQFEMKGVDGNVRVEQELKNDVLLHLHYTAADISAMGWDESKLAVYYWRPMSKEWVRIGGLADKTTQTVNIKAGYLHQYYAVFGEGTMTTKVPGFVSVRTDPKVFTPGADDRSFKNIKISIGFDQVFDKYTVKIYDIRGNLVKTFERSGEYKEGEVFWDARDEEGYEIKSGVYIYKIIAGGNVFSGSIVIAR